MKNKNTIIAASVGLVVIALVAWLFLRGGGSNDGGSDNQGVDKNQVVVVDSPINIALDFYEPWLNALKSTSTNPYQSGLAKADVLSQQLRDKLVASEGHDSAEVDPVTCQLAVPEKFRTKTLYELEDKAQLLVLAKDKDLTGQAVVTLIHLNEGWYIDDISCSNGEVPPEREFTFEKEGLLLKSVVAPLDPKYWHIIYEENGQFGHAAPLFFSSESTCTDTDGNTGACEPDKFMETSKAVIKGQMTESGVDVVNLELMK